MASDTFLALNRTPLIGTPILPSIGSYNAFADAVRLV